MESTKVVVYGIGSVGSGVVRTLSQRKGVEVVGAIDIDPEKVGKDAGTVAGTDPIGVTIVSSPAELGDAINADVAIDTGAAIGVRETYKEMNWAIEAGMSVIVACMETCNLWFTDPDLAAEIDKKCKEHNVTYIGFGATQAEERYIT